jgi:hypothetical protein
MRKLLLALVLGVGMLVPLAIPTAAEAHSPRPAARHYHAKYHKYNHHRYWQNGHWYYYHR